MDINKQFKDECIREIIEQGEDDRLHKASNDWRMLSRKYKYTYHFTWLDRPIIQYPQDIYAMQEVIWSIKPDVIIETGIAHGGSLIFSASMLALLDYCDAVADGKTLDPHNRRVLGIDIDIRTHNRVAIESHPMSHRIDMIEGSSVDSDVIGQVYEYARNYKRVLIFLDSNHTHEHVLAELEAYAPLTSVGSYCVVFDTVVEDMTISPDRSWCKGNSPKTAVWEYLKRLKEESRNGFDGELLKFEIDKMIENKLLITVSPDGYLKRV